MKMVLDIILHFTPIMGGLKNQMKKFTFNSKEVFEMFDNNTIEERKNC